MQQDPQHDQYGDDLDGRLAAYYGPRLPELPLPPASWQELRSQLKHRPARRRWPSRVYMRRLRRGAYPPGYIQDAFVRVAYEIRVPVDVSMLRCTMRRQLLEPVAHIPLLPRPAIRFLVPQAPLEQPALDVLIATGIVRYRLAYHSRYTLARLLLLIPGGIGLLTGLLLWLQHLPYLSISIALLLCLCSLVLFSWSTRKMKIAADGIIAYRLGRERTCRGLHALAEHSRIPYRKRWSELSLAERIERVCGTNVEAHSERLTLVR